MSGERAKATTIRVGMYGRTQAGKSHFLFTLIDAWQSSDRVVELSDDAAAFVDRIGEQISRSRSAGQMGRTEPTPPTAGDRPLSVLVRDPVGDGSSRRVRYELADLRGEPLEQQIDRLQTIGRGDVLADQVRRCDGFLFFFEPTHWELPDQAEMHREREFRRAEQFVRYVLRRRQNRLLPIVCVVTRRDVWNNDAEQVRQVERWIDRTIASITAAVQESLGDHQPASWMERSAMVAVTSVRQAETITGAMGQLTRSIDRCREFERADRRRGYKILFGSVAALLAAGLILASMIYVTPANPGGPAAVAATDPMVAPERFLGRHRTAGSLDDAARRQMNLHLEEVRDLSGRRGADAGGEDPGDRIDRWLDAAAQLIGDDVAGAGSPGEAAGRLAIVFRGQPDLTPLLPRLGELQTERYWQLNRSDAVAQIGAVAERHRGLATPPVVVLGEVADGLADRLTMVEATSVAGGPVRDQLRLELQRCVDLVERWIEARTYEVTMRVGSVRYDGGRVADRVADEVVDRDVVVPHAISIGERRNSSISLRPMVGGAAVTTGGGAAVTTGGGAAGAIVGGAAVVEFDASDRPFRRVLEFKRRVEFRLSKFSQNRWEEVFYVELDDLTGPLAVLGLPLHEPDRDSTAVLSRHRGYTIEMRFDQLPVVPDLIWEAAMWRPGTEDGDRSRVVGQAGRDE